ncbi:TadE/TadG family type IV pilus assembly protein [Lignipirellula cremea]|uniref:TadE-like protein n=1 Tax=Lignipirellula cremea TaxID=2528010 RepID=A0A518DY23_9BACT|nr:TadE family protein [Lignipirellula cremea]QDU96734.1 TadE-like protein [Lignipirellula cremea]
MSVRKAVIRRRNSGTTTIEAAFVLPVFIVFIFGLITIGHAQMISNMLKSSCRAAARYGSTEGVTSAEVEAKCRQLLRPGVDPNLVTITVKNGGVYDSGGDAPTSSQDFSDLDDIELSDAEPRQIFIVRAEVAYNDAAILSLPFMHGLMLRGTAITRHE